MKEIFVFGAGASKASAGTPLGNELVWTYHQDCCEFLSVINGVPDNSEENIIFSNLRKFFVLVGHIFPELSKELEKWENRGIHMYNPPTLLNKKYYVDEILRIVQEKEDIEGTQLIRKLIFEHITSASFGQPNKLYKDFIAKVLKNKTFGSISIISFNFDFLLHEDFRNEIYFDYLIDFDCVDKNRERTYIKQNAIPMIKLNGSLDWGICRKCNRLHLYSPHMQRDFYNRKSCIGNCNGIIEPFIIIPHEKYSEKIEILWEKAEGELKQAEKITVIGYSFPEYDEKVINLFKNALNNNVKIEVVGRCESNNDRTCALHNKKEKYRHVFPKLKNEEIFLDGFEGYMNTIKPPITSIESKPCQY